MANEQQEQHQQQARVVGSPQDEGKKLRNKIMEFWMKELGTNELEDMVAELEVEIAQRRY
jgi:hypothetical protein